MVGLALVAIPVVASAAAAPAAGAPAAPPTGTWAWGALANATYQAETIGAYSDLLNLSSGNLSGAVGVVAEVQQLHAEYGAFAVVNASAPTTGSRYVEAQAAALANVSGVVVVAGDLPSAGTYAPGSPVPLSNQTGAVAVSIKAVSVEVAFANYTVANGTLGLVNEHVEAVTAMNASEVAAHWPSISTDANGSTTVRYGTAFSVAVGWMAENVSIAFSPALPISEAPLYVGKSWNATTSATVTGWAAYAAATAAGNGTTNVSAFHSGAASLNTTASVGFSFLVTGSETVIFPNGTTGTGFEVVATPSSGSAVGYQLWDGLVVLPSAPAPAAAPVASGGSSALVARPSTLPTSGSSAVVGGSGWPLAAPAGVGSSGSISTAPMSGSSARTQVSAAGTPSKPVRAPATTTLPAPGVSTPGTSANGPTSSTGAHPSGGGLDPFLLVAILVGIGAVLLGVELYRERRRA
ncbi:MAG TPA: hypothetical protein VEY07_02885 [Thermoplasmata archaeon]|nr:hypothetical protein [Thermoplasmata archaeon]